MSGRYYSRGSRDIVDERDRPVREERYRYEEPRRYERRGYDRPRTLDRERGYDRRRRDDDGYDRSPRRDDDGYDRPRRDRRRDRAPEPAAEAPAAAPEPVATLSAYSTSRARSATPGDRSPDRRRRRAPSASPSASRSPSRSASPKRRKASKWDDPAPGHLGGPGLAAAVLGEPGDASALIGQAAAMGLLPGQLPGSKKQREVYVGNLTQNVVTAETLRDLFVSLAQALPAFDAARGPPVHNVQMCSGGTYAFVELRDEALASTMMKFHGLEVAGRPLKIGRPGGYVEPALGPAVPIDVPNQILRELGVSGVESAYRIPAHVSSEGALQIKKQRELYVGNLAAGTVTAAMLKELFTEPLRAALEIPPDDPTPLVLSAEIEPKGAFAFVEFRDDATATFALNFFRDMEFCGRPMRVGRPAGYVDAAALGAFGAGLASGLGAVPPAIAGLGGFS